jgi:hypothetical protein
LVFALALDIAFAVAVRVIFGVLLFSGVFTIVAIIVFLPQFIWTRGS